MVGEAVSMHAVNPSFQAPDALHRAHFHIRETHTPAIAGPIAPETTREPVPAGLGWARHPLLLTVIS